MPKLVLILSVGLVLAPATGVAQTNLPPPPPNVRIEGPATAPASRAELARRIESLVLATPVQFGVFMDGRNQDERVVEIRTVGCETRLKTDLGLTAHIDWTKASAEPDGSLAQSVGTRISDGTLASFTAYIPGASAAEQAMGTTFQKEFRILRSDLTHLWKSCQGAK